MSWLIILIVFGVICFQTKVFIDTLKGIEKLKTIFPHNINLQVKLGVNNDDGTYRILSNRKDVKSEVWNSILSSINRYLGKNKGRVSDFALVKDIVDRNVDAAEEDVRELLPVPLYSGLVGTMLGIIVGLLYLVSSEGLETLLSSEIQNLSNVGVGGLLQDVAYAMIGSLFGVGFTTYSTLAVRNAKSGVENKKHVFLSWIQAELLPVMTDSTGAVMSQLSSELAVFNEKFHDNAVAMTTTVDKVNIATDNQIRLLDAVEKLQTKRVTQSSLELYERLSSSAGEIGRLAALLNNSASYLEQVRALNDRLDDSEGRMKTLEEMGEYFMRERTNIERIESISSEAVNSANEAMKRASEMFASHLKEMNIRLENSLEKQEKLLESKSAEMAKVITEVNNLSGVRQLLSDLNKTVQAQNRILQQNAGHNIGLPSPSPSFYSPSTFFKSLVAAASFAILVFFVFFILQYLKVI